ncbi:hypothetical protein E3N88_39988 [Mikania micrantha]|uniref:Uncharacterized protein n=1 Tax=Mikania micrantha TaxID=192012 RepID=A0A5N6LM75_9ASTR|nr:hypothetical protein E3N88_39988 [Mikania micrantha]
MSDSIVQPHGFNKDSADFAFTWDFQVRPCNNWGSAPMAVHGFVAQSRCRVRSLLFYRRFDAHACRRFVDVWGSARTLTDRGGFAVALRVRWLKKSSAEDNRFVGDSVLRLHAWVRETLKGSATVQGFIEHAGHRRDVLR